VVVLDAAAVVVIDRSIVGALLLGSLGPRFFRVDSRNTPSKHKVID